MQHLTTTQKLIHRFLPGFIALAIIFGLFSGVQAIKADAYSTLERCTQIVDTGKEIIHEILPEPAEEPEEEKSSLLDRAKTSSIKKTNLILSGFDIFRKEFL